MMYTRKNFPTLLAELEEAERNAADMEEGKDDHSSALYLQYALDTPSGAEFYRQLTDEILLQVLRRKAEKIGYSPAQKEVFWVWRTYIRERFGKWPYALTRAGLSRSAGQGGKTLVKKQEEADAYQFLLQKIRKKAQELCRVPHPEDLPEIREQMKKYEANWTNVLQDAGITPAFFREKAVYRIADLEEPCRRDLGKVLELARKLRRAPMRSELDPDLKERLIKRCGSYRNALFQIGLEPVMRMHPFQATNIRYEDGKKRMHKVDIRNCYYRVLNLSEEEKQDLQMLYRIWKKTGKMPDKKKADPIFRRRVMNSFGTWANALYQFHYLEQIGADTEHASEK